MAVIIEDKDVPKNCAHCWHSYACNYYKRDYLMLEKYADYKPDNCPIHEVTTGHCIEIPAGATNLDVGRLAFPKGIKLTVKNGFVHFDKKWLDAPYERGEDDAADRD